VSAPPKATRLRDEYKRQHGVPLHIAPLGFSNLIEYLNWAPLAARCMVDTSIGDGKGEKGCVRGFGRGEWEDGCVFLVHAWLLEARRHLRGCLCAVSCTAAGICASAAPAAASGHLLFASCQGEDVVEKTGHWLHLAETWSTIDSSCCCAGTGQLLHVKCCLPEQLRWCSTEGVRPYQDPQGPLQRPTPPFLPRWPRRLVYPRFSPLRDLRQLLQDRMRELCDREAKLVSGGCVTGRPSW
jgi:hypothetical protein